jgi:tripartite-type tricarboxylate transporter receptor subunit TctC
MRLFSALVLVFWMSVPVSGGELKIITPALSGGYAIHARLVSKYIKKFQPETAVLIHAVPGAMSVAAANYLANVAKRDGTEIAHIDSRFILQSVVGGSQIRYDLQTLEWLGATSDPRVHPLVLFSHKDKPLVIGSEGSFQISPAKIVGRTSSLQFREITGYENPNLVRLAFERGEITGVIFSFSGVKTVTPHWMDDPNYQIILQIGTGSIRSKLFPHVPTLMEIARDEEAKKLVSFYESLVAIDRPFVAPPGVPEKELTNLRSVFSSIFKDDEYLEEAAKIGVQVAPIGWSEVKEIVGSLSQYPNNTISLFRGY